MRPEPVSLHDPPLLRDASPLPLCLGGAASLSLAATVARWAVSIFTPSGHFIRSVHFASLALIYRDVETVITGLATDERLWRDLIEYLVSHRMRPEQQHSAGTNNRDQ